MLTITTNSFENDVLHAGKPVLVDFWAQWCPYCRRIAPAFDKVGEQYADTLITGKINYDEEPQLIQRFGIDTIPTLMLFKNGKALGSIVAPASSAAAPPDIPPPCTPPEAGFLCWCWRSSPPAGRWR